jgi:hypothetical protein
LLGVNHKRYFGYFDKPYQMVCASSTCNRSSVAIIASQFSSLTISIQALTVLQPVVTPCLRSQSLASSSSAFRICSHTGADVSCTWVVAQSHVVNILGLCVTEHEVLKLTAEITMHHQLTNVVTDLFRLLVPKPSRTPAAFLLPMQVYRCGPGAFVRQQREQRSTSS